MSFAGTARSENFIHLILGRVMLISLVEKIFDGLDVCSRPFLLTERIGHSRSRCIRKKTTVLSSLQLLMASTMPLMSWDFSDLLRDRKEFELNVSTPRRPTHHCRYAIVYYHVSLVYETGMPSQPIISIVQGKYSLRETLSVVDLSLYTGPVPSCRT